MAQKALHEYHLEWSANPAKTLNDFVRMASEGKEARIYDGMYFLMNVWLEQMIGMGIAPPAFRKVEEE